MLCDGVEGCQSCAHLCAVAFWQLLNEGMCIGSLSSPLYFFLCGVWLAVADVVTHCAGEEDRLLTHQAHLASKKAQVHLSNITSINQHLPHKCTSDMVITSNS